MQAVYYEIERHDGRVVKSEPVELYSLDEVDFDIRTRLGIRP